MQMQFCTDAGEHVALFGLLNGVELTIMRDAMHRGTAQPFPDEKVKSDLTEVGKLLYEQMKLNPDHRLRIRSGETPVGWFLCAVHRIMAPRSTSFAQYAEKDSQNVPYEHYSAMPPWFRDIRPDDLESWEECNLPELFNQDPLPLVYWEGLFYALLAEIRYLYQDLQVRFGALFEQGNKIIHHHGRDARSNEPFSVVEFARLLEICWEKITCPYLTVTLDYAIMQRACFLRDGEIPTLYHLTKCQGLRDVSSMDPVEIIRWLNDKQAAEVKVAVRTNASAVPSLLTALEAVRARRDEIKERSKTMRALTGAQSDSSGEGTRDSTPASLMRFITKLNQSPVDSESQNSGTVRPNLPHGRLAHKPSNLAYVTEESLVPRNLTREHSGQRYPQEAFKPHADSSATSPPAPEPLYHAYTTDEPVQLSSVDDEEGWSFEETNESGRITKASMKTKPSTQDHTTPETQPTSYVHASFDNATHNQSFNLSTRSGMQSFPAFDDTRPLPLTPHEKQKQRDEQAQDDEFPTPTPRTRGHRRHTSNSSINPPPDLVIPSRSNALPTGPSQFGQHDQVQSTPRRPNEQYRYVSAGGHLPLHERDIMEDFELPVSQGNQPETFSMNKEEFLSQVENINQMDSMVRGERVRKQSKASKASTTTSDKREKSFLDRIRDFSKKSSKHDSEQ